MTKIQTRPERLVARAFLGLTAVLLLVVAVNAAFGVIYDNHGFGDTLLLAGAAWRMNQGLAPGVDFGHLYGGMDAQVVSLMMSLFGPDVAAIDRALVFGTLVFGLSVIVVLHKRASLLTVSIAITTLAILLLSRFPLEYDPLAQIHTERSFLYNRIGHAAFLVCGLFVALRAETDRWDIPAGCVAGALSVVALLAKPTFFILAPAVIVGVVIQGRLKAAISVLLAAALTLFALDPTLERWLGSIAYSQAQLAGAPSTEVAALMRKAIQLPLSKPVAALIALVPIGVLLVARVQTSSVIGAVLVALAGLAMASTMGGNGALGGLIMPIAIFLGMVAFETASRAGHPMARPCAAGASVLCAGLALPHAANTMGSIVEGNLARGSILVQSGPFERYLSLPEGSRASDVTQYEMLADGLAALGTVGMEPGWAVAATGGLTFEFAALATPTAGFPLWQRPTTPELSGEDPLSADIKILLLDRREPNGPFQQAVRAKAGGFSFCFRTDYWDVLLRNDIEARCATMEQAGRQ